MKTSPSFHYMQSNEWRAVKTATGWQSVPIQLKDSGPMHYFRKTTPLGGVAYFPGSGLLTADDLQSLVTHLKAQKHDMVCKAEPIVPYSKQLAELFEQAGWQTAGNLQYDYTVLLDLTKSKDKLFEEFKKRARYEVRKAISNGVIVEEVPPTTANLEQMYQLLAGTARRKDFSIRDKEFAMSFWQAFAKSNKLRLFFARHQDDVLSGAVIITSDDHHQAWYKDGASTTHKSNLFGPRLLLWEAAQALKADGYKQFDLGGIPHPDTYQQSHMKGIYIFKTAYAREVTHMMPAYELPLNRLTYHLWPMIEKLYRRVYIKLLKKLLRR